MSFDLSRLLRPTSIAVLGGAWARNVVEQCLKAGFEGDIWPIHPSATDMHGVPCFRSLSELPGVPDAAFVGINRELTIDAIRQLSRLGCGGAICFASGFSEAAAEDEQGVELQKELLSAAAEMPIVGPNCYGLINYLDGAALWPDQHGGSRVESGVALLTQSSNIAINLSMQQRALPIAYVMTAGNQSQLSLGELAQSLLLDNRVTALGLYIESIADVRAFEEMARLARKLGKAVVVIKAGRSQAARQAMISHTNSLSGNDAASDAFFKRIGITRVHSVTRLLETLKVLHLFGPLDGRRVQSMSCSGGEAALVSDTAVGVNVEFPPLAKQQSLQLRKALGPLVALANPLDYHTYIWDDLAAMRDAFYAMMLGDADVTALVLDFPRADRCDATSWQNAITALSQASIKAGRHAAIIASMPENLPEADAAALMEKGIVPLCGLDDALGAIASAADAGEGLAREPAPTCLPAECLSAGSLTAGDLTANGFSSASQTLTEAVAKQRLQSAGLQAPTAVLINNDKTNGAAGLSEALANMPFPLVVKGMGLAHKSEMHAVRMGVTTVDEAVAVKDEMLENLAGLGVQPEGFLFEQQIEGVLAELLVSVVLDEVHGLMLTLAAGGVNTELMKDSAQLLLPFDEADIDKALGSLNISSLLDGFRGKPAVARDKLLQAIMLIQRFALENATVLRELEINPLLCTAQAAIMADALIIVSGDLDES